MTPKLILEGYSEYLYNNDGKLTHLFSYNAQGVKRSETRPMGHHGKTVLRFDESGEKLISIQGPLPDDIDLAYGWGPVTNGLPLGIGAKTVKGQLDDICITESVKNLTSKGKKLLITRDYHLITMELRDNNGMLVPQDTLQIEKRTAYFIRSDHGINEGSLWLESKQARGWGSYDLSWWYGHLAPGKYTLVIRRRSTGKAFDLVSNALPLIIVDNE